MSAYKQTLYQFSVLAHKCLPSSSGYGHYFYGVSDEDAGRMEYEGCARMRIDACTKMFFGKHGLQFVNEPYRSVTSLYVVAN